MRRVRVRLPATAVDFGVGLRSLGLAINLPVTVEMVERTDDQIVVETAGEDAGRYPVGWRHPSLIGLTRLYQRVERAAPGISIRVDNQIPGDSGLGAEAALLLAGMIGANNLLGNLFTRDQIGQFAVAAAQRPDHVLAALHGGLIATVTTGETALIRRLPMASLGLLIARLDTPRRPDKRAPAPERIAQSDALHSLARLPMLLDGLRTGEADLLRAGMDDRIFAPYHRPRLPLYDDTWDFLRRNGAAAMTPLGASPALLIFAGKDPRRLADLLTAYYADEGLSARVWAAHVDTQGVVVSAAQSG